MEFPPLKGFVLTKSMLDATSVPFPLKKAQTFFGALLDRAPRVGYIFCFPSLRETGHRERVIMHGGKKSVVFSESARGPIWFRRLERGLIAEEWRHVAFLNYEVEPAVLHPYVPPGTELDIHAGKTWLSLVGLVFRTGHLLRIPVNLVRSHVQIQLRFYVKRETERGILPGQVVLKELGSRNALLHPLTIQARDYRNLQMVRSTKEQTTHVRYVWKAEEKWNSFSLSGVFSPRIIAPDSKEAFVTQRLWDYTKFSAECVHEVRIKHPSWRYNEPSRVRIHLPTSGIFGEAFESILRQPPTFSLIAEGSPVLLCRGAKATPPSLPV